jgi:hypothetical protein
MNARVMRAMKAMREIGQHGGRLHQVRHRVAGSASHSPAISAGRS